MNVSMFFVFISLPYIYSFSFSLPVPKNSDTYGPYVLTFVQAGVCSETEVGKSSAKLVYITNGHIHTANITFPNAIRIDEVKINAYSLKNNVKKLITSYSIVNPCQHVMIGEIFKRQIIGRHCVVKKGTYIYTFDINRAAAMFFGQSFFYGDYISMALIYSRKQLSFCVRFHEKFTKKI